MCVFAPKAFPEGFLLFCLFMNYISGSTEIFLLEFVQFDYDVQLRELELRLIFDDALIPTDISTAHAFIMIITVL